MVIGPKGLDAKMNWLVVNCQLLSNFEFGLIIDANIQLKTTSMKNSLILATVKQICISYISNNLMSLFLILLLLYF
jgi:hypothetical protein